MKRTFIWMRAFSLITRLAFGALFIWAAFGKIVDPEKFAQQVANYDIISPQASAVVGAILPWSEFIVGSCLLANIWNAGAWLGASLLLACFVAARASVLARGLSVECGCGVMDGTITPWSLVVSVALFLTAIAAYIATLRAAGLSTISRIVGKRPGTRTVARRPSNRPVHAAIAFISLMVPLGNRHLTGAFAASESTMQTATVVRRAGCRQLQSDFDRIVAIHATEPIFQHVTQRLTAMDRVADAVLHALRLHHSAFLNQSLATVGGSSAQESDASQLLGATKIVAQYQTAFAGSVLSMELDDADRQLVDRYFKTASEALTAFIQSRGRVCMSVVGVDGPEIVRLSFILQLLVSDPDQPLDTSLSSLPTWMSHSKDLRNLQTFAIESARPRLAFALMHDDRATTGPTDSSVAYVSFLNQQADAMLRTANYKAALVCLRDGTNVAESSKNQAAAVEFSFHVAEILEKTDSANAAAEEMIHVRSICAEASDYARASMLRLKYLYEAGKFDMLVTEASADLKEPRCDGYLPQIIYIAWVTSRHQGGDTEFWRKEFIEHFPDHPLAAEIYFAAAMDALAQSNADEASRLLQFIEYRFPQSKIIDKVRQVQKNMSASVTSRAPSTAEAGGVSQ